MKAIELEAQPREVKKRNRAKVLRAGGRSLFGMRGESTSLVLRCSATGATFCGLWWRSLVLPLRQRAQRRRLSRLGPRLGSRNPQAAPFARARVPGNRPGPLLLRGRVLAFPPRTLLRRSALIGASASCTSSIAPICESMCG